MLNDLIAFNQTLADYALLLTFQLVLILIARKPVLQLFGAVCAYRLWLLPAIWAPLYFIDWSWLQVGVVQTWVTDTVIKAPVNLMSPAMEWFPDRLSGPLPTTQDEVAGMATTTLDIDGQVVFAGLWLAGVLSLMIRQGLAYRFFLSHVNTYAISVPERERSAIAEHAVFRTSVPLYSLAGLRTPALFGIIKPMLLLPVDFITAYDSDQRQLILSHESVHLHRRDNLWNLCAWSLKVIFWFNPLAHLAYRYYRADQELSCDALALTHSNTSQRNRYAKTLLESFGRSGTHHQSPFLTAWGSLNTIKERTAMIKQYSQRKSSPRLFRVSLLSLMLAGAGITALMTDTLSPTLAADAIEVETIPVDRASLSTTVADTADRTADLIGEREYAAAESMLNNLRALELTGELNAQERFLFWHLAGDLALARDDAAAAVDAYTTMLDMPELNRPQREDAMTQLAEAYIAAGADAVNYKRALGLYTELVEMSDNSNPDHLFGIATTLNMLKQYDDALAATQEAIATYGDNAPRSAYELLWRLTRDPVVKRRAHETLVEKFKDPHDAARLALFTRENGTYNPNVLGGCVFLDIVGDLFTTTGDCRKNGFVSIQAQGAVVTPDSIRFGPSAQPLEFVQPTYPEKARLNGWVGQNLVMLDLDENGAVRDAVILTSNPNTTFNDATLASITQWRFDPSQAELTADDLNLIYISYQLPERE